MIKANEKNNHVVFVHQSYPCRLLSFHELISKIVVHLIAQNNERAERLPEVDDAVGVFEHALTAARIKLPLSDRIPNENKHRRARARMHRVSIVPGRRSARRRASSARLHNDIERQNTITNSVSER
jgi:hypothetical protein